MAANAHGLRRVSRAAHVRLSTLTFLLLAALLAGCGPASSVLNTPAPVSAGSVIPYNDISGVTGLRARDGSTRWQVATGRPSSSYVPIVMNGVLYVQGGIPQQPGSGVVAIRVTDGQVLWHTVLPMSSASLAIDDASVLVADETSGLYALDAAGGTIRWHVAGHFPGPVLASHGVIVVTRTDAVLPNTYVETTCLAAFRTRDGAPLWCIPNFTIAAGISQFAVYVKDGMDNYAALSPMTGHFLWEVTAPGILAAVSDHLLLISDLQTVTEVDAGTGHIIWQASLDFPGKPAGDPFSVIWALPNAAEVLGIYQSEILARRSTDGTVLWHVTFSGYTPDQLAAEDGVVFATLVPPPESSTPERLAALDARTGAVYWERDLPSIMFLAEVSPAS